MDDKRSFEYTYFSQPVVLEIKCQAHDWVSAIVKDDWTKCEKIIKHLKNQKNICFKVLMA